MPENLKNLIPFVLKGSLLFLNIWGEKNTVIITITSHNYLEFRFLWGVIVIRKGERREFRVRGTKAYVNAIVSSLSQRGLTTDLKYLPR